MMEKTTLRRTSTLLISAAAALGAAGVLAKVNRYVRTEMQRRGYPSWDACRCNFKSQNVIFLVCHSRHQQRGETVVSQEWGFPVINPPSWLRRILHYSAQVSAILNPANRYVERALITPQEAQQFAHIVQSASTNEEINEASTQQEAFVIWRREVLHVPTRALDDYTRRLYPVHVAPRDSETLPSLPVLWDPSSQLPLPSEGVLLETPTGTRIDYIGWTPSQISYCTTRQATVAPTISEP